MASSEKVSLQDRLKDDVILCAEGYLFELERRGYLKAGAYVPEVSLEFPEVVEQLHRDFGRAGTDVQVALTYYAHREKLRAVGRENDMEAINRAALRIANKVAKETDALVAGNICNTGVYDINDKVGSSAEVRRQYTEQVEWAKDEGVDFILAETINYLGEALIALEVIKEHGIPAVINFAANQAKTTDGHGWIEAARAVADAGADVVGFNCSRGPASTMPLLIELRQAVSIPIAGVPVPYRTSVAVPSFQSLLNEDGSSAYTLGLESHLCNRMDMAKYAADAKELGVNFIGICCGAGPHHVRAMAEVLGRTVPASKFSPDMSQHYVFGSKKYIKEHEQATIGHTTARFED
ncbi:MAG: homocysteine S-methyltransferase family protein [bacterium]|nr:homocysteine S-methyltransferase family protein [bacterium]